MSSKWRSQYSHAAEECRLFTIFVASNTLMIAMNYEVEHKEDELFRT